MTLVIIPFLLLQGGCSNSVNSALCQNDGSSKNEKRQTAIERREILNKNPAEKEVDKLMKKVNSF
jgi:hypothetical protein